MDTLAIVKKIEMRLLEIGMSKAEFYEKSGISSASYSQWNTGVCNPSQKKLKAAAKAIGVSYEFLTDQKEKPTIPEDDGLTATQAAAMEFIKTLSDEQLKRFIAMGKAAFEDRG